MEIPFVNFMYDVWRKILYYRLLIWNLICNRSNGREKSSPIVPPAFPWLPTENQSVPDRYQFASNSTCCQKITILWNPISNRPFLSKSDHCLASSVSQSVSHCSFLILLKLLDLSKLLLEFVKIDTWISLSLLHGFVKIATCFFSIRKKKTCSCCFFLLEKKHVT